MPKKAKANSEYEKFDSMMQELIKIPHAVIKAKLDAEKHQNAQKQKRKRDDADKRNRD